MEYKLECPFYFGIYKAEKCAGELEFLGDAVQLGANRPNSVDLNNHIECFKCKKCNKLFRRKWDWKEMYDQ